MFRRQRNISHLRQQIYRIAAGNISRPIGHIAWRSHISQEKPSSRLMAQSRSLCPLILFAKGRQVAFAPNRMRSFGANTPKSLLDFSGNPNGAPYRYSLSLYADLRYAPVPMTNNKTPQLLAQRATSLCAVKRITSLTKSTSLREAELHCPPRLCRAHFTSFVSRLCRHSWAFKRKNRPEWTFYIQKTIKL